MKTTLKDLDPASLRNDITTVEGDWYDAGEVEKTINAISESRSIRIICSRSRGEAAS